MLGYPPRGPAGWDLGLAIAGFLFGSAPLGGSGAAYVAGVASAVTLGLGGAVLGWLGLRQVRWGRAGHRGVALSAVIVGLAGVGMNVLLVVEGLVLLLA